MRCGDRWWISREQKRKAVNGDGAFLTEFPANYWSHKFVAAGWAYTDPVSEAQADLTNVAAKTLQQVIEESLNRWDDFRQEIERKIDRTKNAIDRKLEHNGVSSARRTEVRHVVEDVARNVKNALDHVTADGSVTRDEAREVRDMAKALRGRVRARLRAERDGRHSRHEGKRDAKKAE